MRVSLTKPALQEKGLRPEPGASNRSDSPRKRSIQAPAVASIEAYMRHLRPFHFVPWTANAKHPITVRLVEDSFRRAALSAYRNVPSRRSAGITLVMFPRRDWRLPVGVSKTLRRSFSILLTQSANCSCRTRRRLAVKPVSTTRCNVPKGVPSVNREQRPVHFYRANSPPFTKIV
jgi:hypothetical protein